MKIINLIKLILISIFLLNLWEVIIIEPKFKLIILAGSIFFITIVEFILQNLSLVNVLRNVSFERFIFFTLAFGSSILFLTTEAKELGVVCFTMGLNILLIPFKKIDS